MEQFEYPQPEMTETEADLANLEDIRQHMGQFAVIIDMITRGEEDEV